MLAIYEENAGFNPTANTYIGNQFYETASQYQSPALFLASGSSSLQFGNNGIGTTNSTLPNTTTARSQAQSDNSLAVATDNWVDGGFAQIHNGTGSLAASPRIVYFNGSLSSGSATVTLTGASVFANSIFWCGASDTTIGGALIGAVPTSTSTISVKGTGSHGFSGVCLGN